MHYVFNISAFILKAMQKGDFHCSSDSTPEELAGLVSAPTRWLPHLEESSEEDVLVLVPPPLSVHQVALAGPDDLAGLVEGGGVQGVGVDEAHQVLLVVLPAVEV